MSEKQKPVVLDHEPTSESQHEKKPNYIKDSASRILSIAQSHGLDALLQKETPQKTALERALVRERRQKELQQKNLEHILKLAHMSCKNETAGDPDHDWLQRFFTMAQEVHNASMQRLWAQVLKREVTNPGSTSMKALKTLKDMSPKEAQVLQRAASLACSFGGDTSRKLLIGFRAQGGIFSFGKRNITGNINVGSFQLPYSSLLVLFELGLMHGTELESGVIDLDSPLPLFYQGKELSLQAHTSGVRLLYYRFSPTGNELCKLLGNKPNMQYYDQLIALLGQKFTLHTDSQSSIDHTV
ncbi:TIGR03899 family protein [Vibrio zhanjiangensis]|uniref:TIGR03899 family protein n=1 Tax=Vibrio zhanjiangensis TaxID=1046128 RepID=A0ABQ6ESX4_9VIBR|nr:TIGR03899 family protein [Vibrio zhanjiangensis]GLT16248.1 TIGR03899 family protein [Vibrio zhanjiangensis]